MLSGLRYKIGSDTLSYMHEYSMYPDLSQLYSFHYDNSRYNFLWIVFCSFCKSISESYFFMQFVHAVIINAIYFYFIYTNTKHRFFALLLYYLLGFLYFNTEILRESMAIAIFLLSLRSLNNNKWLKYYLFAYIAFLFHSSALIVFVFPFFKFIKINKSFFFSLIIIAITVNVLWSSFNDYISWFFFISNVENAAKTYLTDYYSFELKGIIWGLIVYAIIPTLFVFIAFKTKKEKNYAKEAPLLWFYIVMGIFICFNNTIFMRLQNYTFFIFLIFITNLLKDKNDNSTLIAKVKSPFILLVLLLACRYYSYFKPDITQTTYIYQRYYPYHSILTKESTKERDLLEYYWVD